MFKVSCEKMAQPGFSPGKWEARWKKLRQVCSVIDFSHMNIHIRSMFSSTDFEDSMEKILKSNKVSKYCLWVEIKTQNSSFFNANMKLDRHIQSSLTEYTFVCVCVCTHAHTCAHIHMHSHVCTASHTGTHTCPHAQACPHTHMHTCIHVYTCAWSSGMIKSKTAYWKVPGDSPAYIWPFLHVCFLFPLLFLFLSCFPSSPHDSLVLFLSFLLLSLPALLLPLANVSSQTLAFLPLNSSFFIFFKIFIHFRSWIYWFCHDKKKNAPTPCFCCSFQYHSFDLFTKLWRNPCLLHLFPEG